MKYSTNLFKTLMIAIIVFFSFVLGDVSAQDNFEGKVKFNMDTPEGNMDMDYFTKGKKIKINIDNPEQGGTVSMIMTDETMIMLMPEQKMYMQFPLNMMEQMQESDGGEAEEEYSPEDFPKFKTGETKTINGYECEQYIFEDDESVTEVWATNELGSFFFMSNPMQGGSGIESMFNNAGFFPLLVTSKDKDGSSNFKMEAKEINKMSISDSEFEVPSGYSKFDAGSMFNME